MSNEDVKKVKMPQKDDRLEKAVNMAAEKAALLVSRGVMAELRRIREALESIEAELKEIKEELAKSKAEKGRFEGSKRGGREALLSVALGESGYMLLSEAIKKLKARPEEVLRLATEEGYKVLNVGGDLAVMSEESYEEFKKRLESLKVGDPTEAVSALGAYGRLFDLLRRSGLVYYDHKKSSWVLIEG
ncbi:MAG: hypothetical protein QXN05_02925 [Acidilobaceae archaeon]